MPMPRSQGLRQIVKHAKGATSRKSRPSALTRVMSRVRAARKRYGMRSFLKGRNR